MLKMCSTRIKQMHKKPTKLHLHNSLVSATQALHSCCEQVKKKIGSFRSRDYILLVELATLLERYPVFLVLHAMEMQ